MTIPEFVPGADGYRVLPPGRHTCTQDEFRERFVDGLPDYACRKQIYDDLEEYQRQQKLNGLVVISYWIDGSFTSEKLNPGDIDITAIIDGSKSSPTQDGLDSWINPRDTWKAIPHPSVGRPLLIDGFGLVKVPDGTQEHQMYLFLRGYWDDWWQRCRATNNVESKGYVEVRVPWT